MEQYIALVFAILNFMVTVPPAAIAIWEFYARRQHRTVYETQYSMQPFSFRHYPIANYGMMKS